MMTTRPRSTWTKPLSEIMGLKKPAPLAAQLIAESGLPTDVQTTLARIIKLTRLKHREKSAVAQELISHFQEALATGTSAGEALAAFGDDRTVARLIRRAKVRQRSLPWHIFRFLRYSAGAIVLFYIATAIYFYLGKPTISVNYIDQLNASLATVPKSDIAWPLYRQAGLNLVPPKMSPEESKARSLFDEAYPGFTHFPELIAFSHQHQADFALLRTAAAKPRMGFILGTNGSAYDKELFNNDPPPSTDDRFGPNFLISTLLPHLNLTRNFANMLAGDARVAAAEDDIPRAIADIDALIGISRQLRADPGQFLVNDLVAVGMRAHAFEATERLLVDHPDRLTDDNLKHLAHVLSGPTVIADLMRFNGERIGFYDLIQRVYTDDGHGDGRIARTAPNLFVAMLGVSRSYSSDDQIRTLLLSGSAPLIVDSRKQVLAQYDHLMNLAESAARKPLRDSNLSAIDAEVLTTVSSPGTRLKNPLLSLMFPSVTRVHVTGERALGRQEGLTIALALELYKRRHGQYPLSLSVLSPDYLPTLPVDRITGGPLHYTLKNGRPLLYSVGVDRTDDGGAIPIGHDKKSYTFLAAEWTPSTVKGDWILYPEPPPAEESHDELK